MDDSGKDDIEKFAKDMGVNYPVLLGKEAVGRRVRRSSGAAGKLLHRAQWKDRGADYWPEGARRDRGRDQESAQYRARRGSEQYGLGGPPGSELTIGTRSHRSYDE